MSESVSTVTPHELERMSELAYALLSAGDATPSAAELPELGTWIMTALETRAELLPEIRQALALTNALEPAEAVAILTAEHTGPLLALRTVVAGAYLMHPDVRAEMGYPGQVPRAVRSDVDEYAEMLATVFERGDRYRVAPD